MPQALDTVLNKVCPQRRLIEVKSVEEGDRISPLEGTTAEIERWILQVRQWLMLSWTSSNSPVIPGTSGF